MICHACARGGAYNALGKYTLARVAHESCSGCYCQHRVGEWTKKEAPRVGSREASG